MSYLVSCSCCFSSVNDKVDVKPVKDDNDEDSKEAEDDESVSVKFIIWLVL